MKSIKDLTWNVSEEEYRNSEALHYSQIARFKREGIHCIDKISEPIESESLLFGSVVDCLITEPHEFENRYIIANVPTLTDGGKKTIEQLIADGYSNIAEFDDIPQDVVSDAAVKAGFYSDSRYDKTRYLKVLSTGDVASYWKLSVESEKKIVSYEMYEQASECANSIKNHPWLRGILSDKPDNVEIVFQPKFVTEINNVPYACMFDILVVYHDLKFIKMIDIKTTSKYEDEFYLSFCQFNYDLQSKLYPSILSHILAQDEYFKYFKLAPFYFVVANRYNPHPLLWTVSNDAIRECKINDKYYTFDDPLKLGSELYYYIKNRPYFKDDINVTDANDIYYNITKHSDI